MSTPAPGTLTPVAPPSEPQRQYPPRTRPGRPPRAAQALDYHSAREARRNGLTPGDVPAPRPASSPAAPPPHPGAQPRQSGTRADATRDVTVAAAGTRRRLQALAVNGWTATTLAPHTGIDRASLARITNGTRHTVRRSTAEAVSRLYDRLWDQSPTQNTPAARAQAAAARARARRLGWAPALAWDDDQIDDPHATPHGIATQPAPGYGAVARMIDASEELLAWGCTLRQAADRLGVSRGSLERARHRRGLHRTRPTPGPRSSPTGTSAPALGQHDAGRQITLEARQ